MPPIFENLLMLYGLIIAGFLLEKRFPINPQKISTFLLTYLLPIFTFSNLSTIDLNWGSMPILIYVLIATIICSFACFGLSKLFWNTDHEKDKGMAHLMAAAIPNSNSGYFGIPIAMMLFHPDLLGRYLIANFGIGFFMVTLGYVFYAQSQASLRVTLRKLIFFPALWAFGLAVLFQQSGMHYSETQLEYIQTIGKVTGWIFSIGGMMIIGAALARLTIKDICWKTVVISNFYCFVLWPLIALALLFFNYVYLNWLSHGDDLILCLIALCPIGSNAVLFATEFKLHPGRAAIMVFSSTLIALPVILIASFYFLAGS